MTLKKASAVFKKEEMKRVREGWREEKRRSEKN
jgi:hypothetical protein